MGATKNKGGGALVLTLYASWLSLPPGAKIREKQQMRIQEGHFLKIALNLDLTLSDDGECPELLISSGIIDLGAFCVELWSFFVSKSIVAHSLENYNNVLLRVPSRSGLVTQTTKRKYEW